MSLATAPIESPTQSPKASTAKSCLSKEESADTGTLKTSKLQSISTAVDSIFTHNKPGWTWKKGPLRELRRLWLDLENADYIRETLKLPDCKIVMRVDRQLMTDDGNVVSDDTRYFITSLDPDRVCASDILRHVRNHWRIENCLHFTKDRWWDEDRHHTRRPSSLL